MSQHESTPGKRARSAIRVSSRLVAAEIVRDVLEEDTLLDGLLAGHDGFSRLSPEDRRLAYHLAAGAIKYKRRLDYIARHFLQAKFDRLPANIRAVLRVGLFQLSVSERIPVYAAVNETVKAARQLGHQGTASIVNAVLRRFVENRGEVVSFPERETHFKEHLAEWYSYPGWMIDLFIQLGGEEHAEEFCRWGNREPEFHVRINPTKTDEAGLLRAAREEGLTLESFSQVPGYYCWAGPTGPSASSVILQNGLVSVQNPAAGLVVGLLDPQPKERIMDLFAAPGGKSGAIAERQKNSGRVLAVDKSVRRLVKVNENKERLGLSSIMPISGDALSLSVHQVDRVLADVPCSALGTLPKNPDARWQKSPVDIERLASEQIEYLDSAAKHMREGGVLVYATCTITPQENRMVVEKFLADNPNYVLESAADFVAQEFVDASGFLVTFPPRAGLDCIFAARMRKTE